MATIKRTRVILPADQIEDDDEPAGNAPRAGALALADDGEQTDVDRVGALLQMAGGVGRASVKIYKLENGKSVFCESYSPADFEDGDYKMIRDSFGPGTYKIMLYGNHPQHGTFGLLTRTEITMAENRNPARQQNASHQNSELVQVLASIADGQRQLMQAIADNRPAPVDTMAQMQGMLQMLTLMRTAMGLDGAQAAPKSSITEIIDAVRELKAVAGEIAPQGGENESLISMLPQVLDVIKTATAKPAAPDAPAMHRAQNPIHPMPRVNMPDPRAAIHPDGDINDMEHDMRVNQILELKTHMNALLVMAQKNAEISLGADLVFEKLPDEFLAMLEDARWFDGLIAFEPAVKPHRAWFEQVRTEVLRELREQQQELQSEGLERVDPAAPTTLAELAPAAPAAPTIQGG